MNRSTLKGLVWLGIILSLATPLIYSLKAVYPLSSARAFFFMGAVQLTLFFWIMLATKYKEYRPELNIVNGSVSLFMLISVLSGIFGIDPLCSFWSTYGRVFGLLTQIHVFVFFLILSSFLRSKEDWTKLIVWIASVASVVSLISIFNVFNIFESPAFFKNGSTLGNTSFMGSYLLVAIFIILFGLGKSEKKLSLYLAITSVIVTLGIVTNPGGRAMKGGFIIGLALFILLRLAFDTDKKIIKSLARIALAFGLILAIFLGITAFIEGHPVREEIKSFHGMTARFVVWDIAWQGFKERPLLGVGPENFRLVFEKRFDPRLKVMDEGDLWFDRAHNVVFDNLVSVGIIGTVSYFLMFLTTLSVFWREYFKDKDDIRASAAFTSLFAAHFVQNLTVFDTISSYMLIFVVFAFASSSLKKNDSVGEVKGSKALPIISFLIILITLNLFVVTPFKKSLFIRDAMTTRPEDKTIESFEKGLSGPMGKDDLISLVIDDFIIKNKEDDPTEEEKERVLEKIHFLINKAEELSEEEPRTFKKYWALNKIYNEYYNYHLLEEMVNNRSKEVIEEAKQVTAKAYLSLEKGFEISPQNQEGYWHLIQTIINEGKIALIEGDQDLANQKFEQAGKLAIEAVDLEPRSLVDQLRMLRVLDEILKDHDLASQKAKEALDIEPLWEDELRAYIINE